MARKIPFALTLTVLIAGFLLIVLLNVNGALAPAPNPTYGPSVGQPLPAWLKVYFTDPNPPDDLERGIDQFVRAAIDGATQSIDVTSFDLNLPGLVNALAGASRRGVKVRLVYDGANGSLTLDDAGGGQRFDAIQTLKAANAALVDGSRGDGLMHDKMIIVDGKTLFVGSWNISYNDTYRNNNNLLAITDARLIANYQAKFNELFVDKHFGARARVKVPNPSLLIDGVRVETYMSPEDGVMAKLVQFVQGARKSVHYMAFTFTHDDLSSAMVAKAKSGVPVGGVVEANQAGQGAFVDLFCAGMPVKLDGNPYTLHHKVIVIDGETVITGSFNFTRSADTANDDNVIVIHSPAVAALYEQEYQKISAASVVPRAAEVNCPK